MSKKKKSGTEDALRYFKRTRGPLTLGRTLAAIRETEEASLAAFAKRLGVSRTHLWDVEQGERTVSAERAARWARYLAGHRECSSRSCCRDEAAVDALA